MRFQIVNICGEFYNPKFGVHQIVVTDDTMVEVVDYQDGIKQRIRVKDVLRLDNSLFVNPAIRYKGTDKSVRIKTSYLMQTQYYQVSYVQQIVETRIVIDRVLTTISLGQSGVWFMFGNTGDECGAYIVDKSVKCCDSDGDWVLCELNPYADFGCKAILTLQLEYYYRDKGSLIVNYILIIDTGLEYILLPISLAYDILSRKFLGYCIYNNSKQVVIIHNKDKILASLAKNILRG